MRLSIFTLCVLGACSVPDKQSAIGDGGVDSAIPPGPDGAPNTEITDAPAEFSPAAAAMFAFASDLATATFTCSIDGETPTPCTSPYTRTLNDGTHTFSVRALGNGKSDDTPAEHLWSIDTVMPDTMMTKAPPAQDNSTMVRFAFDSSERNVTFECSLDGTPFAACTSGAEFGPVGDGPHSFAVRAVDRAGNVDTAPAVHPWAVDTSTPDTQLLTGPVGASGSTSATFSFVSPDAGAGSTFDCKLDSGAFTACTSPHDLTGLGEGTHTFAVRVRDSVGNLDPTPATRTWVVDLTAPDTMILTGPTGTVPTATAGFTFTSTEDDVTYECSFDNGAFAACTSPASFTALAQGPHTFAVRAVDVALHPDPSPATRMWTVDTVAPELMLTSGPADGSTSGPYVSFGFTASEGTLECSFDGGTFFACTSPASFNMTAGGHTFTVRTTDGAGNTVSASRAWTVECAPPAATGASGLLHLDDTTQTLENATGGAAAVLGDDATAEAIDPAPTTGRFSGGLAFTAVEGDRVSWPAAIGATSELTVELWARPEASAGTRDLFVSGDGRVAIRVVFDTASTVRFQATVDGTTATSAAVPATAWHRILMSVQAPTVRLWVDDVRTEGAGLTLATPLILDTIRLGGSATAAYGGLVDEVYVSSSAITTDEGSLTRFCPL
ncbi:MAG: putative internalin [Myxococcales bacterium]|nr:putative internalin [Myxococcales bacterium]